MVVEGDLKNLMGRVTRVADDSKVDVMPSMEGLTQVLTFEPGQLEKFFEVRAAGRAQSPSSPMRPSLHRFHVLSLTRHRFPTCKATCIGCLI